MLGRKGSRGAREEGGLTSCAHSSTRFLNTCFTATCMPSVTLRAAYTEPNPPRPSSAPSWYTFSKEAGSFPAGHKGGMLHTIRLRTRTRQKHAIEHTCCTQYYRL
ncbi:hypothetical protein FKM82_029355 [Ascaphus truei]